MKKTYCLALVPFLLLMGCLDASKLDKKKAAAQEAISAEGQATTNIYLDDMVDSSTAVEPAEKAESDPSVIDDTKEARLKAMATKVLDRLDADDNVSLSKTEFAAMAKPVDAANDAKQTPEELAAKQKKLDEQFVKFAGADASMSVAELEVALKGQSDRIGKFRGHNHKGKHKERVKKVTAEVLAKFDANKDGKLDATEIAALRAADKESCKGKGKGGKSGDDMGKGKGGMPGAPPTTKTPAPKPAPPLPTVPTIPTTPAPKPDPVPTVPTMPTTPEPDEELEPEEESELEPSLDGPTMLKTPTKP